MCAGQAGPGRQGGKCRSPFPLASEKALLPAGGNVAMVLAKDPARRKAA
jgi:hypothetical protein